MLKTPSRWSLAADANNGSRLAGARPRQITSSEVDPAALDALVDAYDNPDAATDYTTFSSTFHLPTTGFSKFGATNRPGAC